MKKLHYGQNYRTFDLDTMQHPLPMGSLQQIVHEQLNEDSIGHNFPLYPQPNKASLNRAQFLQVGERLQTKNERSK